MTQLALVIDLNVRVGVDARATSRKEWDTSGAPASGLIDNPYGKDPTGIRSSTACRASRSANTVPDTRRRCTSRSGAGIARIALRAGSSTGAS